jgi:predicted HTH domain antitoxin
MPDGAKKEPTVTQVTLEYPPDLELAVQTTPEELGAQIFLMAALKMFELGKLSLGKAAELAGLSRIEFIEQCARYRVSVFNPKDPEAELKADLEAVRDATCHRSGKQVSEGGQ